MTSRIEREKEKAKQWAVNMGMLPRKNKAGKAIWETNFIGTNGRIQNRKKTIKGRLNSNTFLHKPTTGVALTKKVVKEWKTPTYKRVKHKPSDVRPAPQHYLDRVMREHLERQKARESNETIT